MQTQRALRWAIYAGLFAILFIPFFVANPLFFPFITGKNFAFRIIVEIVFALWIILALYDSTARPKRSALLISLGLLILSLAVSDALGENPSKSFWSNFERMEGWVTFVHLGAYFVVISSIFRADRIWKNFFMTSIGVSVLLSIYGLFQLAGKIPINQGGVRVDATFGNATYLAIYMLFHAFLTLIAAVRWTKSNVMRVTYAIALVLQGVMIFYAATRGTILGLVGGLFLAGLIVLIFGKGHAALRKAGAALALIVVVMVGGFFLVKDSPFVQKNEVLSRLASISLEAGQTRFTIWSMALKGVAERPVLGWGQENFNYIFNKYYYASLYAQEPWFDRAHNQFLDILVAGGVVGFVFYLALFVATLWYLWRPKNAFSLAERALFSGLIAGYAFHNLFVFDNLVSYIFFITVIAYIGMRHGEEGQFPAAPSSNSSPTKSKALPPMTVHALSVAVVVVAGATLYLVNVPGIARAATLIDALKPHGQDLTLNFADFKKASSGGGIGRQEANEQLVQFAVQIRGPQIASLSTEAFKNEVAAYTKDSFGSEVSKAPNDARLRLFYGSFLRQIGDTAGAAVELARAHELSPEKQAILFELGALAADQGDASKSIGYFKQAYDAAPEYDEARIDYASILIRTGQKDAANALLVERFGTSVVDSNTLLQAYLDTKDHAAVVAVAELRVSQHPDDPQLHVQLGAAYFEAGRRIDAVTELRKAIELNPDFKAQGEYYIEQIEAGKNP